MCEVPGFLPPTMELARGWFLLLCMPPLFFEATLLVSWLDMDPFPVILL